MADKRRCVEIAVWEFPKLTDVAIGKLCGVDDKTVAVHRPANVGNSDIEKRIRSDGREYSVHRPVNLGNSQVEKRIGLDGKERPAHRNPTPPREQAHQEEVA